MQLEYKNIYDKFEPGLRNPTLLIVCIKVPVRQESE